MNRPTLLLSCLLVSLTISLHAQDSRQLTPDPALERQIIASGMLHRPLPLDTTRSHEALRTTAVILDESVPDGILSPSRWQHQGLGTLHITGNDLVMQLPIETGARPQGPKDDSDYAIFGTCRAVFHAARANWQRYNRIVMDIYPVCQGEGIMNMNLLIEAGQYQDVGAHLINLRNNHWNHVVFDIDGLHRQQVWALILYTDLKGRNLFHGDSLTYRIRNIRLQTVTPSAKEKGWDMEPGSIAYSMSGYYPEGRKTAVIAATDAKTFELVDHRGKTRWKGQVADTTTTIGRFGLIDFTAFKKEGKYQLRVGKQTTEPFRIGHDAFTNAAWRILNFIFCQRCGYAVEGIHGKCHTDMTAQSPIDSSRVVTYAGGWHDAGDLSQQTLQTADVAFALMEASNHYKQRWPQLSSRLEEEARWGLRFILQCRLGNGYHASSMGLLHWTDGIPGTYDDIHTVRTQNCAYDNFLYAAYEAYAAMTLKSSPASSLRDSLRRAAIEDFQFAQKKYERDGLDRYPFVMEHTYSTPPAIAMATMSWSASMLFLLTGDESYARLATEYIEETLRHPDIGHAMHQSREQLFVQALVALCQSQPHHPHLPQWEAALRQYGNTLKSTMRYTAPFGMVPSGIYTNGDDTTTVRRFPPWNSIFNGNEAILLATGKAAALCGHYLHDNELLQIGREQLYWTVGKNPFTQSLIYGEGHNYPSMDSFSSGEITGEIPVGIRAIVDEDIPYWPSTNNACYKEVWLTPAGKWLSLLAEY